MCLPLLREMSGPLLNGNDVSIRIAPLFFKKVFVAVVNITQYGKLVNRLPGFIVFEVSQSLVHMK